MASPDKNRLSDKEIIAALTADGRQLKNFAICGRVPVYRLRRELIIPIQSPPELVRACLAFLHANGAENIPYDTRLDWAKTARSNPQLAKIGAGTQSSGLASQFKRTPGGWTYRLKRHKVDIEMEGVAIEPFVQAVTVFRSKAAATIRLARAYALDVVLKHAQEAGRPVERAALTTAMVLLKIRLTHPYGTEAKLFIDFGAPENMGAIITADLGTAKFWRSENWNVALDGSWF